MVKGSSGSSKYFSDFLQPFVSEQSRKIMTRSSRVVFQRSGFVQLNIL